MTSVIPVADPDTIPPLIDAQAAPSLPSPEAEAFYAGALRDLTANGQAFLLAGTYAVSAYTGISRPTKDLDIFCRPGDFPRILACFRELGYEVSIEDERWIGKVHKQEHFFDVIFASSNGSMPVSDSWFASASRIEVFGTPVRILSPTELVYSKAFIQMRHRYDGADVAHVILRQHAAIDWQRLLAHMDQFWEVLLMHLMNFRFIYPSERKRVPDWLMNELLGRVRDQLTLPAPQMKVCRGRMLSRVDYHIDVHEWGFADVGGEGKWHDD